MTIWLDNLKKNWNKLKRLHPIAIELERAALIRNQAREDLADPDKLHDLILALGLNDDGLEEFPKELHPYCGQGLHIWQYPTQFSKYLVDLSRLEIRSYMELGIRHGGTFVTTVEYLARFHPLEFAVGIDIMPCPTMTVYREANPKVCFQQLNTQSKEFQNLVHSMEAIDLVFIDANHFEEECRKEFLAVKDRAGIVVLHDITNIDFPSIATVWEEIKEMGDYTCKEYVQQYEGIGPHMGIGMAINDQRVSKHLGKKRDGA